LDSFPQRVLSFKAGAGVGRGGVMDGEEFRFNVARDSVEIRIVSRNNAISSAREPTSDAGFEHMGRRLWLINRQRNRTALTLGKYRDRSGRVKKRGGGQEK
jgi:hypothetical protein